MNKKTICLSVVLALFLGSTGLASEQGIRSLTLSYQNNLLVLLETCRDHQRDGYVFTYYPDGTIKTQFLYDQGYPVGIIKEFDPEGKISSEWSIRGGELNGPAKHFHPNGQLRLELSYTENIPHGQVAYYDNKGQLTQSGEYHWGLLTKLRKAR